MKLKIGIITHYGKMEADFGHLADIENCELIFRVGVMEYAVDIAVAMEKQMRVDAIISTDVTGSIIKDYVSTPVIPLHLKSYNIIEAFYRARRIGERIAFADISHQTSMFDFEYIREMLGYNIQRYKFDHPDDAFALVDTIIRNNHDVIATTASCTLSIARKKNIHAVLIEPVVQDMSEAIQTAKNIVAVQKKEIEKSNWLNAVIENSNSGFITVDQNGVVTSMNSILRNLLEIEQDDIVGNNVKEVGQKSSLLMKILQLNDSLEVLKDDKRELVVCKKEITDGNVHLGNVFKIDELQSLQHLELEARKKTLKSGFVAASTFDEIQGVSAAITDAKQKAKRYALTDSNIFISGESGSGKEIFAQSIHNHSLYRDGPFVDINCTTLPENLLDSELFGFEDGAFTGARKGGKAGLFELAHNGTLFLDEIGEMPPLLQTKLLRVLQEKVVRRIGGSKNIPINVRIILATNRDLLAEVEKGNFREDLYYRINVLHLRIPPLRERKEDIRIITQSFVRKINSRRGAKAYISQEHLRRLMIPDWHGNVRELYNAVERMFALADGNSLDAAMVEGTEHSAKGPHQASIAKTSPHSSGINQIVIPLGPMRDMQNAIISDLYQRFDGDKRKIETTLEMSSTTLWRRFKGMGAKL